MIHRQLLSPPQPLLLKKPELPLLPQQHNRRIIQIIEFPHPHPSLHPQFVAVKSLISDLLKIYVYNICYEKGKLWLQKILTLLYEIVKLLTVILLFRGTRLWKKLK